MEKISIASSALLSPTIYTTVGSCIQLSIDFFPRVRYSNVLEVIEHKLGN